MYKLTYFNIAARGEPARLIFAAAGVKFTDNRVKHEDWPALKASKTSFNYESWILDYMDKFLFLLLVLNFTALEAGQQLPILQVGDKTLSQSKTIYRYLARKFKLTGADEWEAAKCDELVDAVGDLVEGL